MWVTVRCDSAVVKLNTDFITLLYPEQGVVIMASGNEINLSNEEYSELEKAMFPKRKTYSKDDTELAEYFNTLHSLTGGKNEAILTPQRKKKLTDLLKSMTKDQLIIAATNVGKDKWLQGDNEKKKRWGDIDYLLRADKAARWAEYKAEQRRMF